MIMVTYSKCFARVDDLPDCWYSPLSEEERTHRQ